MTAKSEILDSHLESSFLWIEELEKKIKMLEISGLSDLAKEYVADIKEKIFAHQWILADKKLAPKLTAVIDNTHLKLSIIDEHHKARLHTWIHASANNPNWNPDESLVA
jgi:hypothetical protein